MLLKYLILLPLQIDRMYDLIQLSTVLYIKYNIIRVQSDHKYLERFDVFPMK